MQKNIEAFLRDDLSESLNTEPGDIDMHKSLYEQGLDSVDMLSLVLRIEEQFKIEIQVDDLSSIKSCQDIVSAFCEKNE